MGKDDRIERVKDALTEAIAHKAGNFPDAREMEALAQLTHELIKLYTSEVSMPMRVNFDVEEEEGRIIKEIKGLEPWEALSVLLHAAQIIVDCWKLACRKKPQEGGRTQNEPG